jgi:histidinol-phosphatase
VPKRPLGLWPNVSSMALDLELALLAADIADRVTLSAFRRPDLMINTKEDQTPVTEADRGAEIAVRRLLARERPADAVFGEEMGSKGAGSRRWYVDPIDGTANYVRGIPVWATLLGLEVDGLMQLGVVSAPALGRRWWARRGEGAFAGPPGDQGERLAVSRIAPLAESQVSLGGLTDDLARVAARAKRDRGFGDFWSHVLVAEGACEVGLDPVVSIWDIAPLQVIVEEAGGKFTDFAGQARLDTGNAVSSNGLVHDEVIAVLSGL